MAVFDLIDGGEKLALVVTLNAGAEHLGDLVGGQSPQAKLTASLEQLVDGKVALEDKIEAVLDLTDRIAAREFDQLALLGGEFRAEEEGPVVELLANDFRAELIGGGLQRRHVADREKRVVVLAEVDVGLLELMFNEAMAVEVVCGLERDERAHAHNDRAEHLIVNVKVVVSEAAARPGDDAVIGIPGGIFRHRDAEGRSHFHAFENKIDAVVIFSHHAALPAQDKVLLADALLGPRDGDAVTVGKSLNPALVAMGALA